MSAAEQAQIAVASDPQIQGLRGLYNQYNLDFEKELDKAVKKFIPDDLQEPIGYVVGQIYRHLRARLDELAAQPGTSKGGKFWRLLYNIGRAIGLVK